MIWAEPEPFQREATLWGETLVPGILPQPYIYITSSGFTFPLSLVLAGEWCVLCVSPPPDNPGSFSTPTVSLTFYSVALNLPFVTLHSSGANGDEVQPAPACSRSPFSFSFSPFDCVPLFVWSTFQQFRGFLQSGGILNSVTVFKMPFVLLMTDSVKVVGSEASWLQRH